MGDLDDLLGSFDGVSLQRLDERAALLRRIDNKYAVDQNRFLQLVRELREGHELLEIDGRHIFGYSTTYFETPDMRCFVDHIEGRVPRFKARTRLYEDSGGCVFEVKFKRSEGETDKRQIDYEARDRDRLTESARRCLQDALEDAGLEVSGPLDASLTTSFDRITFAAKGGSERLTCDLGVRLSSPERRSASMKEGLVLIETKTEKGDSPADRELAGMGLEPISLSKYRVGMSVVGAARSYGHQPGGELFTEATASRRT